MQEVISLRIDGYIPSVNRYWRHTRQGHHYISRDGKEFKAKLQWLARAAQVAKTQQPVKLILRWHCTKKCRGADLDNKLKVILDALEGIAYEDDKQVIHIDAKKIMHSESDYAEIRVEICQ